MAHPEAGRVRHWVMVRHWAMGGRERGQGAKVFVAASLLYACSCTPWLATLLPLTRHVRVRGAWVGACEGWAWEGAVGDGSGRPCVSCRLAAVYIAQHCYCRMAV